MRISVEVCITKAIHYIPSRFCNGWKVKWANLLNHVNFTDQFVTGVGIDFLWSLLYSVQIKNSRVCRIYFGESKEKNVTRCRTLRYWVGYSGDFYVLSMSFTYLSLREIWNYEMKSMGVMATYPLVTRLRLACLPPYFLNCCSAYCKGFDFVCLLLGALINNQLINV